MKRRSRSAKPVNDKMNAVKATNVFEGVLLLGQDESMLVSVANAERLRNELNQCLAVAAGYEESLVPADEVEPKSKVVIGREEYLIKDTLSEGDDMVVIQFEDYEGRRAELTVPEDFDLSVWTVIE
jgi:hypothetical protein